jgi:hypothetical protein
MGQDAVFEFQKSREGSAVADNLELGVSVEHIDGLDIANWNVSSSVRSQGLFTYSLRQVLGIAHQFLGLVTFAS